MAGWLFGCCGLIFLMVVVGGITRLTLSGLSITEWNPVIGVIPPLTHAQWAAEFARYQQVPEYRALHYGMSLADFKSIYFWEYAHRLLGRLIGVVFAVPLVWFWLRGRLPRRLAPALARHPGARLRAGSARLVHGRERARPPGRGQPVPARRPSAAGARDLRRDPVDGAGSRYPADEEPARLRVGQPSIRRLASPCPLPPRQATGGDRMFVAAGGRPSWRRAAEAVILLVALTIAAGGFVAGTRAGFIYNTFPLMDGSLVPADYAQLHPFVRNWFENIAAIQFDHRVLAMTTTAAVLLLWAAGLRRRLPSPARAALWALLAAAALQVTLGISTLLLVVPIPLAAAHQAGAVLLLTAAIVFRHTLRRGDSEIVRYSLSGSNSVGARYTP